VRGRGALIDIDLERGPKYPKGLWRPAQGPTVDEAEFEVFKELHTNKPGVEEERELGWYSVRVWRGAQDHRRIVIISTLIVLLIMAPPLGGAIKLSDPRYIGFLTYVALLSLLFVCLIVSLIVSIIRSWV
jgi:hypothetical protein